MYSNVVALLNTFVPSGNRKLSNIDAVLTSIRAAFPNQNVFYFAADDLPLSVVIHLFSFVKALVCPHGATLSHQLWLKPQSRVVELAYTGTKSMVFPAYYYWTIANALSLQYGVVPAQGEYDTDMTVDPDAVVAILRDMGI